jgi:hypothetical protein
VWRSYKDKYTISVVVFFNWRVKYIEEGAPEQLAYLQNEPDDTG